MRDQTGAEDGNAYLDNFNVFHATMQQLDAFPHRVVREHSMNHGENIACVVASACLRHPVCLLTLQQGSTNGTRSNDLMCIAHRDSNLILSTACPFLGTLRFQCCHDFLSLPDLADANFLKDFT